MFAFSKKGWKENFALALMLTPLFVQPAAARLVASIVNYRMDAEGELTPPSLLSQTGLYKSITAVPRQLSDSIYPYEVNTALWSDGSSKGRFISVPFGQKITPTDSSNYGFPNGTVLIKNFSIDTVVGDTTSRILIETRFLVKQTFEGTDYFSGLSYRWRRDQSDAERVSIENGESVLHAVKVNGVTRQKRWHYPSQAECNRCHVSFNRGSLGFITQQLNKPVTGNPSLNQLQDLFNKGVLTANPVQSKPNAFRWHAVDDAGASLEVRARSYLAANCSHCHGNVYKAWGSHTFDYFDSTQNDVYTEEGVNPNFEGYVGKPWGRDPLYPQFIYPGRPDSSFILKRLLSKGTFESSNADQMPPLATYQIDSAAARMVRDWICNLRVPATPAGSCKLMDVDYEPYETTTLRHGPIASRSGIRAFFQGGTLNVVYGHTEVSGRVKLFDPKGREIPLMRAGAGKFRTTQFLRPGLYFLKVGPEILRLNYL